MKTITLILPDNSILKEFQSDILPLVDDIYI
jgi:hypothetical protein